MMYDDIGPKEKKMCAKEWGVQKRSANALVIWPWYWKPVLFATFLNYSTHFKGYDVSQSSDK